MKPILLSTKVLALILMLTATVHSQQPCSMFGGSGDQTVLDGFYVKEHTFTRKPVQYPYLREADVMWEKRIWQVIDLREKFNHPLYFPIEPITDRFSLYDVIRCSVQEGQITAYSPGPTGDDDEFLYPMSAAEVDSMLVPMVSVMTIHPDTGEEEYIWLPEPVETRIITQYQVKEDWIFDKQRSQRFVRIIGIAPMMEDYDKDGLKRGYKLLFWLYYPELRYVLANMETFNPHNDAARISFETIFEHRMFQGYIIKESNVYDRMIMSYTKGMDALLESERIKNDLFIMEHDLWHY